MSIKEFFFGDDNDDEIQGQLDTQNKFNEERLQFEREKQGPLIAGAKRNLKIDHTDRIDAIGRAGRVGSEDAAAIGDLGREQTRAGVRGTERARDTALSAEDSADRKLSLGRRYSNDYVENVINDVLGNIDDTFERRRGDVSAGQARKGISKSSRAAVADTLLTREAADARGEYSNRARADNYNASIDRADVSLRDEERNIARDISIGEQGVANTGTALQRGDAAGRIGIAAPNIPLDNYAKLIQGTGLPQTNVSIPSPTSSPGAIATTGAIVSGIGKSGGFGKDGWAYGNSNSLLGGG